MTWWADPKVLNAFGLVVRPIEGGGRIVHCRKCSWPLFDVAILGNATALSNLRADRSFLICNHNGCNRALVEKPSVETLIAELEAPRETRAARRAKLHPQSLPGGPDLDEIVALQVMGWTATPEPGDVERWQDAEGQSRPAVPGFSTDRNAARQLLDRLEELGWAIHIEGEKAQGSIAAGREMADRRGAEVIGEYGGHVPYELAVCRIALLVMREHGEGKA